MPDNYCEICKVSNKKDVTLYSAPKEAHRRDKWTEVCGVTLMKSSFVCHKHFNEKQFYGRRKSLKVDALPTENLKATEEAIKTSGTATTSIKTEPPEFVVVTSSDSAEPRTTKNVSIKEEPMESVQPFTFIYEDCFDEPTNNPLGTNEDGHNTLITNELKNRVLTCGRIVVEIDGDGFRSFRLVCTYCKSAIAISEPNFWQKFEAHLIKNHDSEMQPSEECGRIALSNSNPGPKEKEPNVSLQTKEVDSVNSLVQRNENNSPKSEEDCSKDSENESEGAKNMSDPQYNEGTDDDFCSSDESFEPNHKKSKKDIIKSKSQSSEPSTKVEEIISFDHPNKNCVIGLLELLKANAILWLPRQSIMKRFTETLTEVSAKFNERFPNYAVSKERLRQSINRIKDMYHRGSDERQKRRVKSSMYKMKHPEYFELCATIEENSKSIKQNCDLCQAVFYSPIDLQIHKVKRHRIGELPYKCQRCDYGFTCPEKLANHEQKHNRVKAFVCEYCNKGFFFDSKLQAHLALHTDDSKQICEICGKKFPSLSKYRRHKLHHEAPKEKCEICGKLYFEKWTLSEHMKSHRNERHYKCDICGKKFNRREGVTIHKRGVHKIKTQTKRYVWVNRITNTNHGESSSQNRVVMENEAQNSNSNSSTVSSAIYTQTQADVKPAVGSNPNLNMFPLEMLNSLLN